MKVALVVGSNIFQTGISLYGRMLKPSLEALGVEADAVGLRRRRLTIGGREVGGYVMFWGSRLLQRHDPKYEIVHALDGVTATPGTHVVTIHDIVTEEYPEWYQRDVGARLEWRFTRSMARRAPWLLADSEATRQKVIARWGRAPDTIVTVHLAHDAATYRPTPGGSPHLAEGRPNFVFVGDDNPRKNILLAVRAMAELERSTGVKPRLVRVGRARHEDVGSAYRTEARRLGVDLVEPGALRDDELPRLFTAADALVWPTVAEGFGLPPLEAMACGCPVVANDMPVSREVLGDAPRYHANDAVSMAAAMRSVLDDRPPAAALERQAARYTWEKTARETRAVYERAMRR